MKQRFSGFGERIAQGFAVIKEQAFIYKKTSIVVVLIVAGWGIYHFFFASTTPLVTYQFATVKRGTLSSSVSATGQVTPNSQVDLKPKVNANVVGVNVRAGDRVKTGQVLFRLDATDAYKQVRDAKTSLASANIALEKLRNPKSIDVMTVENSIKAEEQNKKDQDTKVATAYRNLLNSGIQAVPDVAYTSETAPTISGSYSKGVEGQLKITVYQGGPTGYSFSLSGLSSGTGNVSTVSAQPLGDTGLYIKWSATSPTTNWILNIPNKEASTYLTNFNTYQNAVTDRDSANAESDRTLTSLQQKLADLTPGDDNLDVQSALLTVQQRQNALADAEQTLSNYTITAPFDGVMASVSVDIGSSAVMASANSSSALGTIVTDKKLAQIVLNETDVVKVHLGQTAKVTFDAVEGLSVTGTVVEINTLGTVTSGVVTYKVKVAFSADDPRVLPNMSVSVDILSDTKDDVLYVPNQAIKRDATGYYVEQDPTMTPLTRSASSTRRFMNASSTELGRVFASSTASSTFGKYGSSSSTRRNRSTTTNTKTATTATTLLRVPVTIGLQTDTQTEIISGLQEGDQVVTKKTTGVSASNASAPSITSLFRPQNQGRPAGSSASPRAQ
jgi:HlyD family secretion protein